MPFSKSLQHACYQNNPFMEFGKLLSINLYVVVSEYQEALHVVMINLTILGINNETLINETLRMPRVEETFRSAVCC